MSSPALQLIADRWASSGAWGTSAWGTAPWGGQDWEPVTVPKVALGSDSLEQVNHRKLADVILYRDGQPVSVRPRAAWGTWRVTLVLVDQATMDALWVFCQARVFYLLPTGDPDTALTVFWQDQEFAPQPMAPGKFSISFTLEQVG